MSVIAREKTNEISSWGRGHESVCISLIARESVITGVYFIHFFMRFAGGLPLTCNGGISVIAKRSQGESRL